MNSQPEVTIRPMTLADIDTVMPWASSEGWLYTVSDIKAFFTIDPNGSFVAETEGKPRAFVMIIKLGDYAFIPMIYVDKECRNNKVAFQLYMNASMYFEDCCRGSDIAFDKLEKAKNLGFKLFCEISIFCKKAEKAHDPLPKNLVDLRSVPVELARAYDREVYGYDRKGYTAALMEERNNHGLGVMKDGKLVGMGILRQMTKADSYALGPLYADDKEIAKQLVEQLQDLVVGKEIYLPVFKTQQDAMTLYNGWPVYTTELRMYTGDNLPKMDSSRIYGLFE